MSQQKENAKKMGQLIAKCWEDEVLKARLIADPAAVLQEFGMEAPAGVELKVVENSAQVQYLVLPSKPSGEISDEQLGGVAGGMSSAPTGDEWCAMSFSRP